MKNFEIPFFQIAKKYLNAQQGILMAVRYSSTQKNHSMRSVRYLRNKNFENSKIPIVLTYP